MGPWKFFLSLIVPYCNRELIFGIYNIKISQENRTYSGTGGVVSYSSGGSSYGHGRQYIDRRTDWRDVILPAPSPSQSTGIQTMNYIIRGLDPGQNYEAKVQARNKFGWSPFSESFTFQTTDLGRFIIHRCLRYSRYRTSFTQLIPWALIHRDIHTRYSTSFTIKIHFLKQTTN